MLQVKTLSKLGYDVEDARTMIRFAKLELAQADHLVIAKYRERYEAHHAEDAQSLQVIMQKLEEYPQPDRYRVVDTKVLHRSRLERRVMEAAEWVALGI